MFNRVRIDEENELVKKYGLKNKREVWKAKTKVSSIRRRAKNMISSDEDTKQKFFEKLNNLGLTVSKISDVLGLTEENVFERRLETIVFKKALANTPKQARQLIVHKHVLVNGSVINSPSTWVTKDMESEIELKSKKMKVGKVKEKETEEVEEAKEESESTEEKN